MSWNKMSEKNEDDEEKPKYSKEQIENWIEKGRETTSSNLCIGIYGWDGTGKSGVAMDSRTPEEIEEGKEIAIIDLDGSCGSLKKKYFNSDENIIIFNPLEFDDDGEVDAPKTYNKTNSFVNYLFQNEEDMNLHSVIIDGVDTLKDVCGDKMQIEDLNMDPNARIKNSWNWQIRNRYYKDVMLKIKSMNCHRFFITHYKEKKKPVNGELQVVGKEVNWHWSTHGMLYQKVEMRKEELEDENHYKFIAKVEKAKGALDLENEEYVVAEVTEDDAEWYGLHEFYEQVK